ncbi:beta-lactamase family protein [Pseudoxanthomonas sp. NC8]|nr:beta-lactamase family protein [Pseudoxanthomonas sp. NC8]
MADAKPDQDAHVRAIEQGLGPMVVSSHTRLQSIDDRLRYYGVPGISVAVIHDGKLAWAQSWGVRDASTCAPVTTSTQFQAGSISKTIAAAAALRLVESGKLSLDADINSELKQWQLPLPQGAGPVTLRALLSHTAGTTVHGFAGYGQQGPLPNTLQILDGAAPANSAAVRVDLPPGWQFRYSGGGYTVAELAMTDAAGIAYPALVQDEVFAPLDMQRSSVGAPLAGTGADMAQAHSNGHVMGRLPPLSGTGRGGGVDHAERPCAPAHRRAGGGARSSRPVAETGHGAPDAHPTGRRAAAGRRLGAGRGPEWRRRRAPVRPRRPQRRVRVDDGGLRRSWRRHRRTDQRRPWQAAGR